MFGRRGFADMRRAGMGVDISKPKLAQAMLEILIQLPEGTTSLKETVVAHLGLLGKMVPTRDIGAELQETQRAGDE